MATTLREVIFYFGQRGPYTWAAALELAVHCVKKRERHLFCETLTNVVHLFPPEELAKLLDPPCTDAERRLWKEGSDNWSFENLGSTASDDHLRVIMQSSAFRNQMDYVEWDSISDKTKMSILREHRDLRRRDASPERTSE